MKIIAYILIIFTTIAILVSCDKDGNAPDCTNLGDSTVVQLKYGEKTNLCGNESSCLSFTKLISESRCPSDVVCVWQGTASIEISSCSSKEGSLILEIYKPVDYTINGVAYTVELTALNPYPSVNHSSDISQYVASMKVKRK